MYPDWVWQLLLGAAFIWTLGLSIAILRERVFLRELFPKSGERDIRKKFEEVLESVEGFKEDLAAVKNRLAEVEKVGQLHIQRVEMIRYNPYEDTGGDQSFSVTLLDHQGTGVVVTSLHARSGTRVFAKGVVLGKASKYRFSKEEEAVIKKALAR